MTTERAISTREVCDDCAKWLAEVDRLMKCDWFIDTDDAGLDDEQVVRYWNYGDTPAEFVTWFAEKYDLYDFRRPWGTLAGDPSHD